MTVDTSVVSADIFDSGFDRVARVLQLIGPASPSEFQAVLRTLVYLNSAIDLNIAGFVLEVGDGVNQTSVEIGVRVFAARKRRSAAHEELHSLRHLFSYHEIDAMEDRSDNFVLEPDVKHGRRDLDNQPDFNLPAPAEEPRESHHLTYWPASLVVLATVFSALLVIVIWGLIRQKQSGTSDMA